MARRQTRLKSNSADDAPQRTLVVIPCSAAKYPQPESPIAAAERYNGPFYKVLRKSLREGRLNAIRVVVLSAQYGLIDIATPIPFYDCRLDADRAMALAPKVRHDLLCLLANGRFDRICINLGRDYAAMIRDLPQLRYAVWASGGIGRRAATLKAWLTGDFAETDGGTSGTAILARG